MKIAWLAYDYDGNDPVLLLEEPGTWHCYLKVVQIVYAEIVK